MLLKNGFVTLRAIEESDFDLLYGMMNSPEVERLTESAHVPISSHHQREWIRSYSNSEKEIRLMIELDNGNTIGMVSLRDIDPKNGGAALEYKIMAPLENRKKGDIILACEAIMKYAFYELRLNRIEGRILENNVFSLKVIKKLGFQQEGVLRKKIYRMGEFQNQLVFGLLRSEFDEYINKK